MLGWSQIELAEAANVSRATVVDFERGVRVPHRSNLIAICEALEAAGIQFIAENGGGLGVRLSRRSEST